MITCPTSNKDQTTTPLNLLNVILQPTKIYCKKDSERKIRVARQQKFSRLLMLTTQHVTIVTNHFAKKTAQKVILPPAHVILEVLPVRHTRHLTPACFNLPCHHLLPPLELLWITTRYWAVKNKGGLISITSVVIKVDPSSHRINNRFWLFKNFLLHKWAEVTYKRKKETNKQNKWEYFKLSPGNLHFSYVYREKLGRESLTGQLPVRLLRWHFFFYQSISSSWELDASYSNVSMKGQIRNGKPARDQSWEKRMPPSRRQNPQPPLICLALLLTQGLDQMTSRGLFQPDLLCDSGEDLCIYTGDIQKILPFIICWSSICRVWTARPGWSPAVRLIRWMERRPSTTAATSSSSRKITLLVCSMTAL